MTAVLHNNVVAPVIIPEELRMEVEWISSEKASEWLEAYRGPNRVLSDTRVLQYQADMENGRWFFEGSPIRISSEGKLLDGRHRLTALANTVPGLTLPFVVQRGLEPEAQLYMDQGQARTVCQQIGLKGISNAGIYSASAKLYLDWTRDRLFKSTTRAGTTKPEATEWILANLSTLAVLSASDVRKVDAPTSVTGAFTMAIHQISPKKAEQFLYHLTTGAGLSEGSPILALITRLRNMKRVGVKLTQREYLAYFIKAWNFWVAGESVAKLQLPSNLNQGNFPRLITTIGE